MTCTDNFLKIKKETKITPQHIGKDIQSHPQATPNYHFPLTGCWWAGTTVQAHEGEFLLLPNLQMHLQFHFCSYPQGTPAHV